MTFRPLVSVVIPAYNCRNYIEETLKSVYEQEYDHWEIIVVDDGSEDDLREVLQPHAERIRYFCQDNRGIGGARNAGIRRARGELIAFLDNDDLWLPRKLALQVAAMERFGDAGLVFTDGELFDGTGVLKKSLLSKHVLEWIERRAEHDGAMSKGWIREEIYLGNFISSASGVLVKRSCFDAVGGFDEEIRIADDYDMWIRIAREFPVVLVRSPLYKWRYRENSASGLLERRNYVWKKATLPVLEKHLKTVQGEPANIIHRVLYRDYWECGWVEFSENRFPQAREMFKSALRHDRFAFRALVYLLLSFLTPSMMDGVRRARKRLCGKVISE